MKSTLGWSDNSLEVGLARLPEAVRDRTVRRALKLAAEPMREDMEKRAAPRGSRFESPVVINDVTRGSRGDDVEGDAVVLVGPSKAFFYGFEFGTSRQAARPFARPAFDANYHRALDIAGDHMWQAIRAVTK